MQDEFNLTVGDETFLLKRMYVPGYPLTYHIHFDDEFRHRYVFRMQLRDSRWKLIASFLPDVVRRCESDLVKAIEENEE
ncbi:MAG: hypothetical protein JWP27_1869 [Flaviaesturariibacter sp.]|nr:hypothetical protein [Flaviaesturariibacter sp.]